MGHGEPQVQSQQLGIFVAFAHRYGRAVATARERGRCRERLERLSESSLDCESLQREAIAELRAVVGFDRWCWPLSDPEALVPLSGTAEHDYGPAVGRSLELEYSGDDFATMGALALRANPAGSLSAETRGDLARSPRWDEVLRPVGIGDEAAVACRDRLGCWGWIKAYRDEDDASFAEQDLELLAQVGPSLGSALRRRLGEAGRDSRAAPSSPGVVVLDRDLQAVQLDGRSARMDRCSALGGALGLVGNPAGRGLSGGRHGAVAERVQRGARARARHGRAVGEDRGRATRGAA
jgi:hypothetical protein